MWGSGKTSCDGQPTKKREHYHLFQSLPISGFDRGQPSTTSPASLQTATSSPAMATMRGTSPSSGSDLKTRLCFETIQKSIYLFYLEVTSIMPVR